MCERASVATPLIAQIISPAKIPFDDALLPGVTYNAKNTLSKYLVEVMFNFIYLQIIDKTSNNCFVFINAIFF